MLFCIMQDEEICCAVSCCSMLDVFSNWVKTLKFLPHLKKTKHFIIINAVCSARLPLAGLQTIFTVCLQITVFLRKSGTFQRLSGFNEPQFCASGGCWVSGMKLIICPADCH